MAARRTLDPPRNLGALERTGEYQRPVKTSEAGRTCDEPECTTILSIYNLGDRCGVHEERRFPPAPKIRATRKISHPNRLEKRDVCFKEERTIVPIIRQGNVIVTARGGPTGRVCYLDGGHDGTCDYR